MTAREHEISNALLLTEAAGAFGGNGRNAPLWRCVPQVLRPAPARAALAVMLTCLPLLTGCHLYDRGVIIEITQQQIQERLAKKFPMSRNYLVALKLTLSDPEVVLEEGSDRIGFGVSAATNIKVDGENIKGRISLAAGLRYRRDEGALTLRDPAVEQVAISLLPKEYEDEVVAAADLAVGHYLEDYPIYKLDPKDLKQRIAKLVLQEVAVRNGVLRVKLGVDE